MISRSSILRDQLGNEIKIGSFIAYATVEYGGSPVLKFGVVTSAKCRPTTWSEWNAEKKTNDKVSGFEHIVNVYSVSNNGIGNTSVSNGRPNPRNFLVILESSIPMWARLTLVTKARNI